MIGPLIVIGWLVLPVAVLLAAGEWGRRKLRRARVDLERYGRDRVGL